MNLKKLEVFYLAAKNASCSKAAEQLLISQPAVTVQIRDLETFYNLKLFVRAGKSGLKLTKAGKILYSSAKKIFSLVATAENRLRETEGERAGVLTIGTTDSYASHALRSPISLLQHRYPGVKVIVKEGTRSQMLDAVRSAETDFAIVPHIMPEKSLFSDPFRKEEIFVLVSQTHKWFFRQEVGLEELKDEVLVLREEGSATRNIVLRLFRKHGVVVPKVLLEGNFSYIKEMVKEGEAISFLAPLMVEDEIKQGIFKLLRVASERLFLQFRIFYLGADFLSPPAKTFLQIIRTQKIQP